MRLLSRNGSSKGRSELPGSKPHYPPPLPFTIRHMKLQIEPDLKNCTIIGRQELTIRALQDIDTIELDAVDLRIDSVIDESSKRELEPKTFDNRLILRLDRVLHLESQTIITISYAATPKRGFYFIAPSQEFYPQKHLEAWTQGQTIEARHWYPCIDHPSVRFTSEILVSVPKGFDVISNGELVRISPSQKDDNVIYHWSETNPHPSYLISVVIGRYDEERDGALQYYVPEGRKEDIDRSFGRTLRTKQFLEEYFGHPYPYRKYSQVTVQDFLSAGMENFSCTTLTTDILHDEKSHLDFSNDKLVAHELAHQWFGDLVTCSDWQHLWVNEGFATYSEALYWQKEHGEEEFEYAFLDMADAYLGEAASGNVRPIVTNIYRHPDDLFDTHPYEKAACVVHMIRKLVGEKNFRLSLQKYLEAFAYKSAETEDLRKVIEQVTGEKSLQKFFDQWLHREGHPDLKVEFSSDAKIAELKIDQAQPGAPFDFPLEVRVVFSDGEVTTNTFSISSKESTLTVSTNGKAVNWFSIDPEFKILKTVSTRAPLGMLINQLHEGKTIFERVEAARALRQYPSEKAINALQHIVMCENDFWGVRLEAAGTIGQIGTDYAFGALKECLTQARHPKVRRAVVNAIGGFRKRESFELLKPLLKNDQSYFVQSEAAAAIGKTRRDDAIELLKDAANTETFQNIVAQGAIGGLKEFAPDESIAKFLIDKSRYGNHHKVREAATTALGKFIQNDNEIAFDHLRILLKDSWFKVRINACRAFAYAEADGAVPYLKTVALEDIDAFVRKAADEAVIAIEDAMKKRQAEKPELKRGRIVEKPEPLRRMVWDAERHT